MPLENVLCQLFSSGGMIPKNASEPNNENLGSRGKLLHKSVSTAFYDFRGGTAGG